MIRTYSVCESIEDRDDSLGSYSLQNSRSAKKRTNSGGEGTDVETEHEEHSSERDLKSIVVHSFTKLLSCNA